MSDPNTPGNEESPEQPTTPLSPPQAPQPPQAPVTPPGDSQQQAPQFSEAPHAPQPPQYPGGQQFAGAQQGAPYGMIPAPTQSKGLALTAMILGLVALVGGLIFSWIPFVGGGITILIGIAAIILGILAMSRRQSKGMSLTGLITGGVAVLIGIISIVAWSFIIKSASEATSSWESSVEEWDQELDELDDWDSDFDDDATTSGDRSAEFCTTFLELASVDVSGTELSPELLSTFEKLSTISSPNQQVYADFAEYVKNPTDTSVDMSELLDDYVDAAMEDSMACM